MDDTFFLKKRKQLELNSFFFFQVLQITKAKDQEIMHNSTMRRNPLNNHTKVAIVPMRPPAKPIVDTCDDNLCFNGGFCDPLALKCRCRGHFIGKVFYDSII